MGSVEFDLQKYEAEQEKAYARDEYAIANRDKFMSEAIDEEVEKEFSSDLASAADHLADLGDASMQPFVRAYKTGDDTELGRLIRALVEPYIRDSAVCRAERLAAEEFDAL